MGLYVRNDLNFIELNEFTICNENIESIVVEITCSNKPITVGVLYRPPSGDLRIFNKELEAIVSKLSDNNCYSLRASRILKKYLYKIVTVHLYQFPLINNLAVIIIWGSIKNT